MKKILALIFCLMFAATSHAATITVAQSGNWSSTSTWVGGALPQAGDTVSFVDASILTVNGNYSVASVTAYNYGGIIIDTSRKLTITGTSAWGSTSPQMSFLTMRAGSELSIGGTMTIGAIKWITENTTASSPAKITGTGNVSHTAASKRSNITLNHFVMANTSTFSLAMGSSSTSIVTYTDSGISFTNCVILPGGKLTMGTTNTSIQNRRLELVNCDVRARDIDMNGNMSPVVKRVVGNTFVTDPALGTTHQIRILGTQPTEPVKGNIFSNYALTGVGPILADENLFFQHYGVSGTMFMSMGSADGGPAARVHRNYAYTNTVNSHGFGGGSVGTDIQNNCTENVIEIGASASGGPNVFMANSANKFISRNLVIGKAVNLAGCAGMYPGALGITITRNTITGRSWTSGDPLLVLTEGGTAGDNFSGPETIRSNLVAPSAYVTGLNGGTLVGGSGGDDTWHYVGYNAVYNLPGTKYMGTITNDFTSYDVALSSPPGFVDPTRNMATWGQKMHGVSSPSANATAELLLKINGFDSATGKQTATPFAGTVSQLLEWVRAGFSPSNSALKGTGYGGEDIGAIDVGKDGGVVDPPNPEPQPVYNKQSVLKNRITLK